MHSWQTYYRPCLPDIWTGRVDQVAKERIHQWVVPLDEAELCEQHTGAIALIGFACDEGVRRNHGRVGAAKGPQALRKALANVCLKVSEAGALYDLGDIICPAADLEGAQEALAMLVAKARRFGLRPLVIGGGHETAWGHYQGLTAEQSGPAATPHLAIVNYDAHFDLRPTTSEGGNSGTPFRQIAEACKRLGRPFDYTCLGIQPFANSASLFETARDLGVCYVLAEDMLAPTSIIGLQTVKAVISRSTPIYVSLCLDVLSSAVAPGVSAVGPWGLMPWHLLTSLRRLLSSGQVVGFDIVELAPPYDHNEMTARQAAYFVAEALRSWRQPA